MTSKAVLAAIGVVIMAAIVGGVALTLRSDYCDGLPRSIGACSSDRPAFNGRTCDAVAVEWGRQLDNRVIAILEGPTSVGDKSRSSLLLDAETLTTQLANKHMRDTGLTASCSVEAFLNVGESEFSATARREVGSLMFEASPVVDYETWRNRLEELVTVILAQPFAPYDPANVNS